MKIAAALSDVTSLCLDTSPLIYYIENHPKYGDIVNEAFTLFEKGNFEIVVSSLVLTETMSHPIQSGNPQLASAYYDLIVGTEGINAISVDIAIAKEAASLRAKFALKTIDALHIATAIVAGCDAFLTNDQELKRVTDIAVLVLSDFV
jgi:predicted nucleic acid-binding protein